jgi:hypothetical protein
MSGACKSVPFCAKASVAMAPGIFLAQSVVPSSGSTAISTFGPDPVPTFSPMNSIGASSISPSPINRAVDCKAAEFAAHGIDGGLVGFLFGAAPAQPGGGNCGALGHTHDLKGQSPIKAGILTDRL